jgi:hypothetical protein
MEKAHDFFPVAIFKLWLKCSIPSQTLRQDKSFEGNSLFKQRFLSSQKRFSASRARIATYKE